MEDIKTQLFSTPILRVLDLLLQYPNTELSDTEVTNRVAGVKRAAVHQALTRLAGMGVLRRERRGRKCFSTVDFSHAWLAPLKIASDILSITPVVEGIKAESIKIILFGSRAAGTSRYESDFDLAVVSNEPDAVRRIAAGSDMADRLQLIVKTPSEMLDLDAREPVFAAAIRKGVVVWER